MWPTSPSLTIAIEPGETIVLYTDGVTDTRGERERFGDGRLQELLASAGAAGGSPAELLARLDAELADFQVGAQADDTAVIAMRLTPAPAPTPAGTADLRQRARPARYPRRQSMKGSVSATPESSKTR